MSPTLPLPHELYLLSHVPAKSRLDDDSALVRGSLLRAAAVADLRIAGLLRDRDGKAERAPGPVPGGLDPFLAEVLDSVRPDRPRRWFGVVDHHWHTAERAVRESLVATGTITAERRRVLLVVPARRIEVPDRGPVQELRDRVRDAVLGGGDPGAVPIGDAVLAVLADEGYVRTVFRRRELRAHKPAVRALNERVDRELPGLRTAMSWSVAARRTAATS
ncbi:MULTISPECIES: GPP34 family phosphoprotein [unclassified Pseudonocardia]|uniref:GOLPH3/VPS74 family protein n=1 Tax=unclassified Pseudonocardia TaxID=2619320 RepID=UPI0001FFE7FA|nr:GPP34 family phosphoprotein [Pseudonocardia sp. Ae707_Ps1]OLM20562.1 hypothetical protein Ae707Ps1_4821c [Pseudonocardia sp. Ae707_Ps1]